jgi:hypothetical protein
MKGAEIVVDGSLLEVVDVRLPNGADELIAANSYSHRERETTHTSYPS